MRLILERLAPRIVPGGHLIIDDYRTKEDCRKAVDDYFRGRGGFKLVRKSRLHMIRN
jgi:asparagine synthase (glutamine-hydrolysing)